MYYTIGKANVYEEALKKDPGLKKAVGGYASSLKNAIKMKFKAERGEVEDLPIGLYNVYELPLCTQDIVENEMLLKDTPIGEVFDVDEPIVLIGAEKDTPF